MRKNKRIEAIRLEFKYRAALIITCVVVGVAGLIYFADSHWLKLLTHIELSMQDFRIRLRAGVRDFLRGRATASSDIVLIKIDEPTVRKYGSPPSRESEADIVHALSRYQAKVIAFDLTFEREREKEFDATLAFFSKQASNLIFAFTMDEPKPGASLPKLPVRLALLHPIGAGTDANYIPARLPYPALLESALHLGHIEAFPDLDGAVRRVPLLRTSFDRYYPALSLMAVCAFKDVPPKGITVEWGKRLILDNKKGWRRVIPIDEAGRIRVNYLGNLPVFRQHSFGTIHEEWLRDQPRLPLDEYFNQKLALIGNTYEGADKTATPFARGFPGVGVHATIIDNILRGDFIRDSGSFNVLVLICFACLMVASQLLPYRFHKRTWADYILRSSFGVGTVVAFFLFTFALFYFKGVFLNLTLPLFAMGLGYVVANGHRYVTETREFLFELQEKNRELELTDKQIQNAYSILKETYSRITGKGAKTMKNAPEAIEDIVMAFREIAAHIEESHQYLLNFINVTSHDLRAPLNHIQTQLKALDEALLSKNQNLLNIEKHTSQGIALANNILDAARIRTGIFEVHQEPDVQIKFTLEDTILEFRPEAEAAGINLKCQFSSLPRISADKSAILRVMQNLLSNAIKFTEAGGCIQVIAQESENSIEIQVSDTGIGIEPENLGKIFEAYYTTNGTGLGLTIVKRIVELHDGSIEVESTKGEGSTFIITLPKQKGDENDSKSGNHFDYR